MMHCTNLLCYEIATRIQADEPQALIPYLSNRLDYKSVQNAPTLLFTYRRLMFKEGTQDEAKMREKEKLYIDRIIQQHHLNAEVISVEVVHEYTFPLPTKYLFDRNPVCFSAYYEHDDEEF
ncbi:hypothetical protein KZ326_07130 [Glaesserella parasuis]|nr:hypothetical protein [Glaesserella parasuis]